jgi:NADPH-dependent curcumin reductase CurA
VGQIAGQIAKICGCRVVGIAGIKEKCDFLVDTLGFDAAVSHLSNSFQQDLDLACPDGVDIYFENVGGKTFEAILPLFNKKARISLCGLVSQYGNMDGRNPQEVWHAAGQSTFDKQNMQVHSLFVGNYVADYEQQFLTEMGFWLSDGLVKYKEDLWSGLDKAPEAFAAMLAGKNFGKTLVSVHADPSLTEKIINKRANVNVLA